MCDRLGVLTILLLLSIFFWKVEWYLAFQIVSLNHKPYCSNVTRIKEIHIRSILICHVEAVFVFLVTKYHKK